jgi:hypothetical protein
MLLNVSNDALNLLEMLVACPYAVMVLCVKAMQHVHVLSIRCATCYMTASN